MKRSAFVCRVLVCLPLGAVTTAAVAWVIAWRTPVLAVRPSSDSYYCAPGEPNEDWNIVVHQFRGAALGLAEEGVVPVGSWSVGDLESPTAEAPRWTRIWLHEGAKEPPDPRIAYVTGWPALVFGCEVFFADDKDYPGVLFPIQTRPSSGGVTLEPRMTPTPSFGNRLMSRVLPLRPIWSGLALNTLVYGAGWMFIVFGPWGWRSWRRRRRVRCGRCAACGYDLRGGGGHSARCPECGDDRSGASASAAAGAGSEAEEM